MKHLAVLMGALLLIGCAGMDGGDSAKKSIDPAVQTAIDDAVAANKKAASVGYEWRDAGKMIKDAQAAAETGDNEKALSLAKKAKTQGELGYAQGMTEKSAGPRF